MALNKAKINPKHGKIHKRIKLLYIEGKENH